MELTWRAIYHDGEGNLTGEVLNQYEKDGTENKYANIDRFLLARFDMLDENEKVICSVYLRKHQRLIFRRRTFVKVGTNERTHIFLVGWQQTIHTPKGPKNVTAINYIYADGGIALDGHRHNLELVLEERG